MASIRKKLSIVLGLSHERSASTSKANSMDASRGSLDSGYHSMIARSSRGSQEAASQETTFITSGMESSPERSPKKLHKAISSTFSGAMQAFSNTVRSTTSYIYPSAGEPELPSSEWAECETPKKESRRSSIMSSVRRRKQRSTPLAPDANIEFPELPQSPVPVTQEKAPAIDVEIPNASIDYESMGRGPISIGSQLLAGVKLPAGPKNLWPGPIRLTVDQALGNDKRDSLHSIHSKLDDPYVEKGDRLQHGLSFITSESDFDLESPSPKTNKSHLGDDKGYFSEVESNADVSESDGLPSACLKGVAPVSTEVKASSPCCYEDPAASHVHVASSAPPCQNTISSRMSSSVSSGSGLSKAETLDGTAEQSASLQPPSLISSHYCASLEDGLNALFPSCDVAMTSNSRPLYKRLSSDVYDADAESLESGMGSRAAWERHRADRDRRYMEIVDMAPSTESDEEAGPELELKRSPSKKPVHYAEALVQGTVNSGESESTRRYPTGDLRFAVEAIERTAFPVGDLAYAVEAIERPSVTTFDPLETVLQQRPMLCLSDTIQERGILQVSNPHNISPSRMESPSTPPADLSPSRVDLPSSPVSSPLDIPAVPKHTVMMKLTDEELMTFEAGNLDGQSICWFSSGSTDVSANSSPVPKTHTAQGDAYEAGLKAGGLLVPTYLSRSSNTSPVKEDAYEAGLRAAGIDVPMFPSDVVQARPTMDSTYVGDTKATSHFTPTSKETSRGTYRERLEAEYTLPKPRSRNGTPFEHNRTLSFFSDDTDDSCAITTHSPSCNVPPPFPSLHVRSEPARRIPSAIDALAIHGDEQIRIAGPANAGIKISLPSPFDGTGDQVDEAGSKPFSPKALEGATSPESNAQMTWLEQHDLQFPSPDTTSSIQSPTSNTPQETFNAAKLPGLVSPSHIASRKARRKQKKSSSGIGKVPSADLTMNPNNIVLQPEFSPFKPGVSKDSALGKTQTPLSESTRIAQASNQKPSLDRQLGGKKGRVRDETSLEGFPESFGGNFRWLDPGSESKSSKKSPSGKGQAAATLPMTPSPPRTMRPQASKGSSSKKCGNVRSASKGPKPRFDPELRVENFDSMSDNSPLYANRRLGTTSHGGHELDSVFRDGAFVSFSHEMDGDLQQDSDKTAVDFAGGDETIGNDSGSDKDVPHAPGRKKKGKPHREVAKKFSVQRELGLKSDRAQSRLVDKLKSGDSGDDHNREDNSAHKEGRRPGRP